MYNFTELVELFVICAVRIVSEPIVIGSLVKEIDNRTPLISRPQLKSNLGLLAWPKQTPVKNVKPINKTDSFVFIVLLKIANLTNSEPTRFPLFYLYSYYIRLKCIAIIKNYKLSRCHEPIAARLNVIANFKWY